MKSCGLSCEDAQDENDWKWRIKGAGGDPFVGKWLLKQYVCVHDCMRKSKCKMY